MSEMPQKNGTVIEAEEPPHLGVVLQIVPRSRAVPSLTDEEILAFRAMREQFEKIRDHCPLAQRALGMG